MSHGSQKTAAIYARVRTLDQNCDLQLQDLWRYAGQRFGRSHEPVDICVSRKQPQLDALLTDAHRRLLRNVVAETV